MILGRSILAIGLVGCLATACAPTPSGSGAGPSIRWIVEPSGQAIVSVVGLDPGTLGALKAENRPEARWAELFEVGVRPKGAKNSIARRMLGSYRVEKSAIQFRPLYPLDFGVPYRAEFRPDRLPGAATGAKAVVADELVRVAAATPPTTVSRVDPAGDVLPENLLKFYVHFSGPMSRGSAYEHVQILDGSGESIDLAFLELGEELWDRSMTRLTLLLDPGRIKRGLKPREESGPILESGRSYTFVVDPAWPDAAGRPLAAGFRKSFRAGPTDETQPDPKTWTIEPPRPGTIGPLRIRFPEPLDRAMLDRAIRIVDNRGRRITGRVVVEADATTWQLSPGHGWNAGDFGILVDPELEDLAGNSIRRPFEVDAARPISDRPTADWVSIPIQIRPDPENVPRAGSTGGR